MLQPLDPAMTGAMMDGMIKLLANPEAMKGLTDFLFPPEKPKDNIDVAQLALDAYRNGKLTRNQVQKIILACLIDDAEAKGKTIDIKSKRIELESLFN